MIEDATWLVQAHADMPATLAWLAPRERARLDGMPVDKRRSDFVLGRWTAKRALADRLGAAAGLIEIRAADDGAPEPCAAVDGTALPWTVSIAHSAGHALAVVRPAGRMIGCDLERIEPRDGAFVEDFFTRSEVARVAACPAAERDRLVTLIWSAKESALKALRVGLREDTRRVSVAVGAVADPAWGGLAVTVAGAGALTGWWRVDGGLAITVVGVELHAPPCRAA